MPDWLVPLSTYREQLSRDGKAFHVGLRHGTMKVELYRPGGCDPQVHHLQDEIYIVIAGRGSFVKAGERRPFCRMRRDPCGGGRRASLRGFRTRL